MPLCILSTWSNIAPFLAKFLWHTGHKYGRSLVCCVRMCLFILDLFFCDSKLYSRLGELFGDFCLKLTQNVTAHQWVPRTSLYHNQRALKLGPFKANIKIKYCTGSQTIWLISDLQLPTSAPAYVAWSLTRKLAALKCPTPSCIHCFTEASYQNESSDCVYRKPLDEFKNASTTGFFSTDFP